MENIANVEKIANVKYTANVEKIANVEDTVNSQSTQNTKYAIATIAAGIFMSSAYYLPAETFMGFFAAVLFLIPTAFFIYMMQKGSNIKDDYEQ